MCECECVRDIKRVCVRKCKGLREGECVYKREKESARGCECVYERERERMCAKERSLNTCFWLDTPSSCKERNKREGNWGRNG